MGLEDVRARLRDRQTKDGARGTQEVFICLDVALVAELEELERDLEVLQRQAEAPEPGKPRLGGQRTAAVKDSPEVVELKAAVEAKEQEVRAASLRLVFRSLGSPAYQAVVNDHPDANESGADYADFLNALAASCLREVWQGRERVDDGLTWDEIRVELSYGEWESTTTQVLALNRRKVDVPFSLRPSRPTRS